MPRTPASRTPAPIRGGQVSPRPGRSLVAALRRLRLPQSRRTPRSVLLCGRARATGPRTAGRTGPAGTPRSAPAAGPGPSTRPRWRRSPHSGPASPGCESGALGRRNGGLRRTRRAARPSPPWSVRWPPKPRVPTCAGAPPRSLVPPARRHSGGGRRQPAAVWGIHAWPPTIGAWPSAPLCAPPVHRP